MADDLELDSASGEDEEVDEAVDGGEESSGGKKPPIIKMLQIGVGGLLLIIIMILISVVVNKVTTNSEKQQIETPGAIIKSKPLQPWEPLGDFNAALAPGGDGQTHFIQVKIVPAYDKSNKKIQPELNSRRFQLRDIVNTVLAKKRYTDLIGAGGKDRLIKELMARFNNVLIDGQIKALYLPKYTVQ